MINKLLKSRIFFLCLGLLIAGSVGAIYAASVASSDVSYDNTNSGSSATTVKDAIDELYSKAIDGIKTEIVDFGVNSNSGFYHKEIPVNSTPKKVIIYPISSKASSDSSNAGTWPCITIYDSESELTGTTRILMTGANDGPRIFNLGASLNTLQYLYEVSNTKISMDFYVSGGMYFNGKWRCIIQY